jgi:hypothetical protein
LLASVTQALQEARDLFDHPERPPVSGWISPAPCRKRNAAPITASPLASSPICRSLRSTACKFIDDRQSDDHQTADLAF